MTVTLSIGDLALSIAALIGAAAGGAMVLTAMLTALSMLTGRLPEMEDAVAAWLLRDAEAWRARNRKREELAQARPLLARSGPPPVEGRA